MDQLILGLVLFLGVHSVSIFALSTRDRLAAQNAVAWKIMYGLVSAIGLFLIIKGYGAARLDPVLFYVPPTWLRHVALLLLIPVFVFFLAPYFPGRIKTALKHPQLVAVKIWATAHLLANGTLADVLLFGSFLIWAVVDRISMKRRPLRPVPAMPETKLNDFLVVLIGLALYVGMVMWGHRLLIGVPVVSISG